MAYLQQSYKFDWGMVSKCKIKCKQSANSSKPLHQFPTPSGTIIAQAICNSNIWKPKYRNMLIFTESYSRNNLVASLGSQSHVVERQRMQKK